MTPKSITRSKPFIKLLVRSKPGVNKAELLRKFPDFVINDIIEIIYNIVTGNLPVQTMQKRKLTKYKRQLTHLVNIPKQNKRREFMYKQKGNFIGALLPIVASIIGGLT
jgi:hypothetical protein